MLITANQIVCLSARAIYRAPPKWSSHLACLNASASRTFSVGPVQPVGTTGWWVYSFCRDCLWWVDLGVQLLLVLSSFTPNTQIPQPTDPCPPLWLNMWGLSGTDDRWGMFLSATLSVTLATGKEPSLQGAPFPKHC